MDPLTSTVVEQPETLGEQYGVPPKALRLKASACTAKKSFESADSATMWAGAQLDSDLDNCWSGT